MPTCETCAPLWAAERARRAKAPRLERDVFSEDAERGRFLT